MYFRINLLEKMIRLASKRITEISIMNIKKALRRFQKPLLFLTFKYMKSAILL